MQRRHFLELGLGTAAFTAAGLARATPVGMPKKWDETHDFVVIGAGSGGLAAAYARTRGSTSWCWKSSASSAARP